MLPRPQILWLLVCLTLLSACSLFNPKLERPTVTVASVQLRAGNLLEQTLTVKLHIENPNDRALSVRGLHAEVTLYGDTIAIGDSEREFSVPALGQTDFDMAIRTNLMLALAKIGDRANRHEDNLNYELNGEAKVDFGLTRTLRFHYDGSLSLKGFR